MLTIDGLNKPFIWSPTDTPVHLPAPLLNPPPNLISSHYYTESNLIQPNDRSVLKNAQKAVNLRYWLKSFTILATPKSSPNHDYRSVGRLENESYSPPS